MTALIIPKRTITLSDIPSCLTDDKPVVFWDACSLLYFNTMIERRAYKEFAHDKGLFELVVGGRIYSVTSSIVYQEFNKHHTDFQTHDADLENSLRSAMKEYGKSVGGQDETDLKTGMNALKLSSILDSMVREIWQNTFVIEEDITLHQKAHSRVVGCIPPSSNKKQEYKDCYIWDTFLALCDHMPHKGQAHFISENTEEYCGKKSKILLPDNQNELTSHQGQMAISKLDLYVPIAKQLGIINTP